MTDTSAHPRRPAVGVEVAREIFERVPSYSRNVLACTMTTPIDLAPVRQMLTAECRRLSGVDVSGMDTVRDWRAAFKQVGIATRKFRPSPESLLRRVAREEDVETGHPLVDLGTLISIRYGIPVGMHVIPPAVDALELRFARDTDVFETFAGVLERPEPGEVVYAGEERVLTRRWVWRQGAYGSITNVPPWDLAINIDSLDDTVGSHAVDTLTELIADLTGTTISGHALLTNDVRHAELTCS